MCRAAPNNHSICQSILSMSSEHIIIPKPLFLSEKSMNTPKTMIFTPLKSSHPHNYLIYKNKKLFLGVLRDALLNEQGHFIIDVSKHDMSTA